MNCPHSIKRVFSSKHFRTLVSGALALWLLALVLTCAADFTRLRTRLNDSVQEQLYNVTLSISDMVSRARTNAVTVGSLASVRHTLESPAYQMDAYVHMAEDISSTMAVYEYRSVDLFHEAAGKIYVSPRGMYDYTDYPDPSILEILRSDQPYELWTVRDRYPLPYPTEAPDGTLVYIRQLPIYSSEPEGYVVFYIPMEFVRELIRTDRPDCGGTLLISFNGTTIFSDDEAFPFGSAFPSEEALKDYARDTHATLISSSLQSVGNCSFLLPNAVLYEQISAQMAGILPVFLLFLLMILACTFGYSMLMLGPLDRILHQTAAPGLSADGDEYQQLSKTVSDLSSCIDLLTDELQRNLQPIQERYIIELTTNYTDISARKSRYEEIGISLPYPRFAVILVGCANIEGFSGLSNKEQIKLLLRDRLRTALDEVGIVYTANVAEERLMLLVNSRSEDLVQQVQQACTAVSEQLQDMLPQVPTFSIGSCTAGDGAVPYFAYLQARNNMTFSGDDQDGELLIADDSTEVLPAADSKTAEALTGLLLDHDLDGIRALLEDLFRTNLPCSDTPEHARRFAESCLCVTLTRMLDLDLDMVPDQASGTLRKLAHASSGEACIELLADYFSTVINGEKKLPLDAELHVHKAVDFIHAHYTENLTVPQIAESVALSSIYLNKLFKLSTGRTISDYLNFYRAEKAKEMLVETDLPLSEISFRLGYNDVRSLVRFFKKYHGITPGEYRQNAQDGAE